MNRTTSLLEILFREIVLFEKLTEFFQKLREIVLPMNSKCKSVNSPLNLINFTENHFTFLLDKIFVFVLISKLRTHAHGSARFVL